MSCFRMSRGLGDCYEAAGKYMLGHFSANLLLVHAEVTGQGTHEGTRYGHAWVEDGNTVFDHSNGRKLQMPQAPYYLMGRVSENGNIHKYTMKEMQNFIRRMEHWGPWELITSSGL